MIGVAIGSFTHTLVTAQLAMPFFISGGDVDVCRVSNGALGGGGRGRGGGCEDRAGDRVLGAADPVSALRNSNFFQSVVLILPTTDLPTLVKVSRFTDLIQVCPTFRDMSKDSLACCVNCSMLKNISWAVRSSCVGCWTDDGGGAVADAGGTEGISGSTLELNMLDNGDEHLGVTVGVGGLGTLFPVATPAAVAEV